MEPIQDTRDGRSTKLPSEGYLSYAGGVNAFPDNHREIGPDQLRHIVNGTVRGGWVETRPAFTWITLSFTNSEDKRIFEKGKIQGSGYYGFADDAVIVYAVDGNLFAVDPVSHLAQNINPPEGRPFSKHVDFVYFQQRAGYLISGDGINPQVITEGYESRLAKTSDREVPTGLMMADDWGRLAIVDPDRRRIRFSNHEMNPNFEPLGFDETTSYYLNTRFFTVPSRFGRIVGIHFLPWLDTDTGTGPLAVIQERAIRYYDVSIERSEWSIRDISGTMLPTIGGISHRAQVSRNDDLVFSDHLGRIRSMKNARQDEKTRSVKYIDRPVFPYYEHEAKDLRRFRVSVEWHERILTTIQPESIWIRGIDSDDERSTNRYNVRHRGIVVWNGEVSEGTDERDRDVWDGLWTGICPATLDVGLFAKGSNVSPEEICIALSVDEDGVNRLYRIEKDGEGRYDLAPNSNGTPTQKRIEMQLVTREFDFSARDADHSMKLKSLDHSVMRVGERTGKTDFSVDILSDQATNRRNWFKHKTHAGEGVALEECRLEANLPQQDRKLIMPSDTAKGTDPVECHPLKNFYKCTIAITVTGWARIEEMLFGAVRKTDPEKSNTSCKEPESVKCNRGCDLDLFRYKTITAEEAVHKCCS